MPYLDSDRKLLNSIWQPTKTFWVNQTLFALEQEAKRMAEEMARLKRADEQRDKHAYVKLVLVIIIICFVILLAICCLIFQYTHVFNPDQEAHELPDDTGDTGEVCSAEVEM